MKKVTLPKLKQKLQELFNTYIRKRDEGKPCISCGKNKPLQAGHYYPIQGYDYLRYDEDNVHGECAGCNCFDQGHLIHYGENLVGRIGENRFRDLKDRAWNYRVYGYKWSRSEIDEKITYYKNKLKDYEKV